MTRHIVLFKFSKDLSDDKKSDIDKAFKELPSQIEEISSMEGGTNNSPENLGKGFTHGYILTFPSEKERDIYLPHEKHKAFTELIKDAIDDVLVFDYNIQ